jgi:MarR family transcriptional regulator, transcriptional regulator for hemolysin
MGIESFACRRRIIGKLSRRFFAMISEARARVEQPTMAEMLTRMERDGVVRRETNPADKRGSISSLTRSARGRLPKATEALIAGERGAMAGLSDDEQAVLIELLQRVVKNLER